MDIKLPINPSAREAMVQSIHQKDENGLYKYSPFLMPLMDLISC